MSENSVIQLIANYYTQKINEFGRTPRGVDWKDQSQQDFRYKILLELIDSYGGFSIADIGCGYGRLAELLDAQRADCEFIGVDLSEDMIRSASAKFTPSQSRRFLVSDVPDKAVDYIVASGIFNVRMDVTESAWKKHIHTVLDNMNRTSIRGFAFNCLTKYSDAHMMRADLHYADPCEIFDHCKMNYSKFVSLRHDYQLYEFTIFVHKEPQP